MEECPCIVHAWIMRDVYTPRTHNTQTHIYGPINCWVGWKVYNINVLINYWYKLAHISIASSCNGIPYATYSVWMLFSLYLSLLLCVSLCAFMYACVNAYFHFFSSMLLLFLLFSLTYFDFFVHRSKSILKCMAWTTTVLQSASSLPFHWIFFNLHLTFFFILFMLCFHQRFFTVLYKNEAFFLVIYIFGCFSRSMDFHPFWFCTLFKWKIFDEWRLLLSCRKHAQNIMEMAKKKSFQSFFFQFSLFLVE